MAVASAPVSRVRSVQCKALFGSTATKQASSEFYSFKVKVRWDWTTGGRGGGGGDLAPAAACLRGHAL